jgi:hypothetical protein
LENEGLESEAARMTQNEEKNIILSVQGSLKAVRHSTTISYPPIENSFNGCQGHPLVCLPLGTARRQLDPEVKRFERAAIYSANICRQL